MKLVQKYIVLIISRLNRAKKYMRDQQNAKQKSNYVLNPIYPTPYMSRDVKGSPSVNLKQNKIPDQVQMQFHLLKMANEIKKNNKRLRNMNNTSKLNSRLYPESVSPTRKLLKPQTYNRKRQNKRSYYNDDMPYVPPLDLSLIPPMEDYEDSSSGIVNYQDDPLTS